MAKYVYDKKQGAFVPKRATLRGVLLTAVTYVVASLLAAAVFYAVFALAFSTEREKSLEREHQLLAAEYAWLSDRLDLLDGAVGNLRLRDRDIYRDLFSADPPNYLLSDTDTLLRAGIESDSMTESDLVWDAYALTNRMESTAQQVSRWLADIDTALAGRKAAPTAVPSLVPLTPFSPRQTGASVGKKVNPFYKTIRDHAGIDLVAPAGTPVRCSADGRVVRVERSEKGMGNLVAVEHPGGFQTVYAHLDNIRVSAGQPVRQGAPIGTVGQTGSCFAPCLHYEVHRNGLPQEPVNYFFSDLDPVTYRDMMVIALTTGQSMD